MVVAGLQVNFYSYARQLAERGTSDRVLVPQTKGGSGHYAAMLSSYCSATPATARHGQTVSIECFARDVNTTEGKTSAATRIARDRR